MADQERYLPAQFPGATSSEYKKDLSGRSITESEIKKIKKYRFPKLHGTIEMEIVATNRGHERLRHSSSKQKKP